MMLHKWYTALGLLLMAGSSAVAASETTPKTFQDPRPGYWQQKVSYTMEVDMDVKTYIYQGKQSLEYTNNSPDALDKVYYHLYFNAFQPGSEMDVRSRTIKDPDSRVGDRISKLAEDETGYLKVLNLTQNGADVVHVTEGTVLEVTLNQPVAPGETVTFAMNFEGRVPAQIRRSGRNNEEGVALSMTQWFPKMAEYDFEGWHAHPYIAREFHGVWGDFDVKITIDKDYVIGGTGYLQNPQEIGHGYEAPGTKVAKPKGKKLTWHFKAPQVHDFAWAADPEYVHDQLQVKDGPVLHFFYKNDDKIKDNWKKLQPAAGKMMEFFSRNIGPYPWDQYSIIQGGDGGMEYAMCTLITGNRKFGSLAGVTAHEMAHAWFQHLLATNESKHEWMDEGFTSFISDLCMNEVLEQGKTNPFEGSYASYYRLATSGLEQPQTTQADRYHTNFAYGVSAYSKGSVFLSQLGYVIGQDKLMETIRKYYEDFKFTHPTPNDFKRVAEKVSGMHLDWYLTDWTQTTNTIDYAITGLEEINGSTRINLERKGLMPMPLDVMIFYKDGTIEYAYVPLRMQRGEKANPFDVKRTVQADWAWAYPTYSFDVNVPKSDIRAVVIDPSGLMADIDRSNNTVDLEQQP